MTEGADVVPFVFGAFGGEMVRNGRSGGGEGPVEGNWWSAHAKKLWGWSGPTKSEKTRT